MTLQEIRSEHEGFRWTVTDIPFTNEQKEVILEYLASQLWEVLSQLDPTINHGGWKWYDPLTIRDGVALSYVFELEDGGRRHKYRDLAHLEQMLLGEVAKIIREQQEDQEEIDRETISLFLHWLTSEQCAVITEPLNPNKRSNDQLVEDYLQQRKH